MKFSYSQKINRLVWLLHANKPIARLPRREGLRCVKFGSRFRGNRATLAGEVMRRTIQTLTQAAFAVCVSSLIWSSSAIAQPDTLWTRSISYGSGSGAFGFVSEDNYVLVASSDLERRAFQITKIDFGGNPVESRTYNPAGRRVEQYPYSACRLPDGGIFMSGEGFVRTNSRFDSLWTRSRYEVDGSYGAVPSHDGNIILVGGNRARKISDENEGEEIWERTYENVGGSLNSSLNDCHRTEDGGYIFAGSTARVGNGSDDFYAAKVDAEGEIEWENTYGSEALEVCPSVTPTSDGGWCLAGSLRYGEGGSHRYAMLVRIDSDGEVIWHRVYDDVQNGDYLRCIIESPDGGFTAVGQNRRSNYLMQMRVDCNGNYLWGHRYGFWRDGNRSDWASGELTSVLLMEDGGYVVCGNAEGGPYNHGFIARTEPDTVLPEILAVSDTLLDFGEIPVDSSRELTFSLFNPGGRWTEVDSIVSSDPAFIVSFDQSVRFFPWDTLNVPVTFAPTSADTFTTTLTVYADTTMLEIALTGRGLALDIVDVRQDALPSTFSLSAFPNPFNASTTITFSTDGTPPPTPPASGGGAPARLAVYDLSGREVVDLMDGYGAPSSYAGRTPPPTPPASGGEGAADRGGSAVETHKVVWDASDQPAGVYLVRLEARNRSATRKIVLMR